MSLLPILTEWYTSNAAAKKNNKNDEIHIAVIDKNGAFTGTKGSVLERFAFLSMAKGAKDDAGSTIFAKDVVNDASQYVWLVGLDSDFNLQSGRRGFDQALAAFFAPVTFADKHVIDH